MIAVSIHLRRPSATSSARAWAVLDEVERARARRFHRERDAHRFATARLTLREALSRRDGRVGPADWRFSQTPAGQTVLEEPSDASLAFSVSRTDDLVAVAVSAGPVCGVDLETVVALPDLDELATGVLGESERQELDALANPGDRAESFLRAWTLKEAYGKAIGRGLDYDLESVAVRDLEDGVALDGPADDWSAWAHPVSDRERLALVVRRGPDEPVEWDLCWEGDDS